MYGFLFEDEDIVHHVSHIKIVKHEGDIFSGIRSSFINKPKKVSGILSNPKNGNLLVMGDGKYLSWYMESKSAGKSNASVFSSPDLWSVFCTSPNVECSPPFGSRIKYGTNCIETKESFNSKVINLNPNGYIQLIANMDLVYLDRVYRKNAIFSLNLIKEKVKYISPAIISILHGKPKRLFVPRMRGQLIQINAYHGTKLNDSYLSSFLKLKESNFKNDEINVNNYFYRCHDPISNDVIIISPKVKDLISSTISSFVTYLSGGLVIGDITASFVDNKVPIFVFSDNINSFWFNFRNKDINKYSLVFNSDIISAGFSDNKILVTLQNRCKWIKLNIKSEDTIEITHTNNCS